MVGWGGLSKAFYCFPHYLITVKLETYGLELGAITLTYPYVTNRKQRVKVNEAYSSWIDAIFGVPQWSILGPLLFNIYFFDLFYFLENFDIASYADDTTIHTTEKNKESVIAALETSFVMLLNGLIIILWKANNE